MGPTSSSGTLYKSKVFWSGFALFCIAVIAKVSGELLFSGILGSLYFLPIHFLAAIALYASVPLIAGAIVWFFIQKARTSRSATLKLRFTLCAVLLAVTMIFFHILVTQALAYRITMELSVGNMLILVLIAISLVIPIAALNFLIQFFIKVRRQNPSRKLNTENKLSIVLITLVGLPLLIAFYVFVLPMLVFFIGLSSTSY